MNTALENLAANRELISFLATTLPDHQLEEAARILERMHTAEYVAYLDLLVENEWLGSRTSTYKLQAETFLDLLLKIIKKCKPGTGSIDEEVKILKHFLDEQKAPPVTREDIRRRVEAECAKMASQHFHPKNPPTG